MSDTSDKMTKLQTLKFIRVISAEHIPRRLVELIKHREFSIEDFYKSLESIILVDQFTPNPYVHVYVLVDQNLKVVGFFWMTIDPVAWTGIIENFVVDPDYWGQGKAVKLLTDYLKTLCKKLNVKKVFFGTRYPQVFERYGFKKSKTVLMEYEDGRQRPRIVKSKSDVEIQPGSTTDQGSDPTESEHSESDQPVSSTDESS